MDILCVDDEPTILDLLELSLTAIGNHDVVRAEDAQKALAELNADQRTYRCFLLDIQMPGMSGVELCAEIRKIEKYQNTPIIMLTAMSDEDYIEQAFIAGATDYVTKPFNANDLNLRVKSAIARAPQPEIEAEEAQVPEVDPQPEPDETTTPKSEPDNTLSVETQPTRGAGDLIGALAEVQRKAAEAKAKQAPSDPSRQQTPPEAMNAALREISRKTVTPRPALNPYKIPVSANVEEQSQRPARRLSDPITLFGDRRCLAHLTFERYLETMTAHGRMNLNIFSVGITGADAVYLEATEREFGLFLKDMAKALGQVLRPYRSLYSYFGNGIFCGTLRQDGLEVVQDLPELLLQEIEANRDQYPNLLGRAFGALAGDVHQAGLFRSPVSRLKSALEDMNTVLFESEETS